MLGVPKLGPQELICGRPLIYSWNWIFNQNNFFFLKMGQYRPLFVYFRSFLSIISIQIEKSIDDVLGIRTRGRRVVGIDETTELWRPPRTIVY